MAPFLERALELIAKHRLQEPPGAFRLFRMARAEGILVSRYPFNGRIAGTYIRSTDGIALITVKRGLAEPQLKRALAFGLGLHCLGAPAGVCLDGLIAGEDEDAAEDFAALLLLPHLAPAFRAARPGRDFLQEAARVFRVPVPLVHRRLLLEEQLRELLPRSGR
ncbi:hypothetical protein [Desulfovirgula thermocuniculi]|uniref:hypothetical protein n=1 Tax=Desulfovirgula thermocuniculi TaxID=348842 RepID=UPI0004162A02|nr:hypothetical protein [Desulfovirgula thermocuniculi]